LLSVSMILSPLPSSELFALYNRNSIVANRPSLSKYSSVQGRDRFVLCLTDPNDLIRMASLGRTRTARLALVIHFVKCKQQAAKEGHARRLRPRLFEGTSDTVTLDLFVQILAIDPKKKQLAFLIPGDSSFSLI